MRSHELLMAGLGSIRNARVGPYLRNIRDWDPTHADCDTSHRIVGDYPLKNNGSHIDASLSRQPLVKGERLVRAEMNAVIMIIATTTYYLFGAFATVCLMRAWSLSLLTSCACLRVGARPDGFLLYLFEPTLPMGKWKHIRALRRAYGVDPISSMPEDSR